MSGLAAIDRALAWRLLGLLEAVPAPLLRAHLHDGDGQAIIVALAHGEQWHELLKAPRIVPLDVEARPAGEVSMVAHVFGEERPRKPVDVPEAWQVGDRVELDGAWFVVLPGRQWRGPVCLVQLRPVPAEHEGAF